MPRRPTTHAIEPPISSHMVLSVGEPVKKREKLDPIESEALIPKIIRQIPPRRRASETILFMMKGA